MRARQPSRLDELVMKIYGDQISEYARGVKELEQHAIGVSIPAVAALTLPEEYSTIVLASRMDYELRKLLEGAFHLQGDAEELLFEFNMPFGSFSNKINATFSFGYLTKKMFEALTSSRKVRNAFAHHDNPDEARESKDYKRHASRLLKLDPEYAADCIKRFKQLRERSAELITLTPRQSDIVSVMVSMSDTLGTIASAARMYRNDRTRIPACFGHVDMLEVSARTAT